MRERALGLLAAVGLAGCASFPENPPLGDAPVGGGYRYERIVGASSQVDPWSRETLVFVSLSGGGTRAAAFAYGVLDQLRRTCIDVGGERRRLLDEVDILSSNSGGSYAAAYYGLFGEAMFAEPVSTCGVTVPVDAEVEDFETRFLRRPFQSELAAELVNPATLVRIASPYYSRSDRAAELADEIFHGRTFADLEAAGRPFVVLNAHDTDLAARFAFTQETFDLLCADLGAVPVGRAVMASSAVHGAFRSIRLVNYDGRDCWPAPGTGDPRDLPTLELQIRNGLASRESNFARFLEARRLQRYRYGRCWYLEGAALDACMAEQADPLTVHLNDGGVVDNLGIDTLADFLLGRIGEFNAYGQLQTGELRRVVVVMVDARRGLDVAGIEDDWDGSGIEDAAQGLGAAIDAKANASVALVDALLEAWVARNAALELPSIEVLEPVVLRVDALEDPGDPATLASVRCWSADLGTTLELDDAEVDAAIHAGRRTTYAAPAMRRLIAAFDGEAEGVDEVDYCEALDG
jgi:NTE family protein